MWQAISGFVRLPAETNAKTFPAHPLKVESGVGRRKEFSHLRMLAEQCRLSLEAFLEVVQMERHEDLQLPEVR